MANYTRVEFSEGDESLSFDEEYDSLADLMELNRLCAGAFPPKNNTSEAVVESDISWAPVREWLSTHSLQEVREAADQRGDSSMTALHYACRNGSPMDVFDVLLRAANETVQWPDASGWLPIHYACAYGAPTVVIRKLAQEFPESKIAIDKGGRTPLHYAFANQIPDRATSPAVVEILSSTGAASYPDEYGMLVSCSIDSRIQHEGGCVLLLIWRVLLVPFIM